MDRKPVPQASSSAQPSPPVSYDHTTEPENDDDLPGYSGPSSPAPRPAPSSIPSSIPGLPPVDFRLFSIPGLSLSKDSNTLETSHPQFSTSAPALLNLIQTHVGLPPHPQIRIVGVRDVGGVDFDIRISLMSYLVRSPEARGGRWNYMRMLSDGEMGWRGGPVVSAKPSAKRGLEEWVQRYVAEESKDKSFTLHKQVANWNTDYLEGQIRTLIASMKYTGKLTVTFPVTHSNLTVHPPKNKAWYAAIAAAFTPAQNRRYQVVTAVWPYAALAPGDAGGQGNEWAVKSEMQWWNDWKDVLKLAVLSKRKGWLTAEDQMEWSMGLRYEARNEGSNWE